MANGIEILVANSCIRGISAGFHGMLPRIIPKA
jgi:hypothetical protein